MAVFTDLNLDGDAPVRARPELGEWGPVAVDSTAVKKRHRIYAVAAFVIALGILAVSMTFWYRAVMGY
ncbi:MAG: hypothetical protein LBM94_03765 [Propionibacteriaceae bacterium]|jgi:hypothetical protein|nr:hypothetical protein [Propionibacteriaceae bacterium]